MAENQSDDLFEGTYRYAIYLYQEKDWSNAIKWLSVVVKGKSDYEDAADLLHKAKEELKQTEYKAGIQALHNKRWDRVRKHFEKVADIDSKYSDVESRLEHARKGLELSELYASVQELLTQEKWDIVIPKIEEIVRIDKDFKDANFQLKQARRFSRADQLYEEAMKQYVLAKEQDGEMDWRKTVDLFKEIKRVAPDYKRVDSPLKYAKTRLKLVIHYKKGSRHLDRQQWLRAIWHLSEAYRIDSTYSSVEKKLQQAKQGLSDQWRKGPFGPTWRRGGAAVMAVITVGGCIFMALVAFFPTFFASIGTMIAQDQISPASPIPTLVIPSVDKI